MKKKFIFVYGTLMEGFHNYKEYLQGKVISRKPARVRGNLFHLFEKGYPALITGNDYIYGELITIRDFAKTIVKLDKLEGFYNEDNQENEYDRVLKDVEIFETGEIVQAYLYQYNSHEKNYIIEENEYIPEGNWREYLENVGESFKKDLI